MLSGIGKFNYYCAFFNPIYFNHYLLSKHIFYDKNNNNKNISSYSLCFNLLVRWPSLDILNVRNPYIFVCSFNWQKKISSIDERTKSKVGLF